MEEKTIRFYEGFVNDIKEDLKTQTIRYDWDDTPNQGEIMEAVSTQEGDVFAEVRVQKVESLSMGECVSRNLDGHVNYDSVEEMVSDMSQYYPSISSDDSVLLLNFKVVEWKRD